MGVFNFKKKKEINFDDLNFSENTDLSQNNQGDFQTQNGFNENNLGFHDDHFSSLGQNLNDSPLDHNFNSQTGNSFDSNQQSNRFNPQSFNEQNEHRVLSPKSTFTENQNSNQKNQEIELISSKIDVIKTMLENINHRLINLESKVDRDIDQRKKSW